MQLLPKIILNWVEGGYRSWQFDLNVTIITFLPTEELIEEPK